MFVRFVCNQPHPNPNIDAEIGMFAARDAIDFSKQRRSIQRAHEEAFFWFSVGGSASGGGLTYPQLKGAVRSSKIRKSLFWFREDAKFGKNAGSVVARARQLASVMTLAGCEVREIWLSDPGEIVWGDRNQVLALPNSGKVPRAF